MARLVIVMPTWAPDSWVDRERSAFCRPWAPLSPAWAAWSTWPRSTVTKENSAATNTPQARISSSAAASSNHAVIGALPQTKAGRAADFESRPWAVRQVLTGWGRFAELYRVTRTGDIPRTHPRPPGCASRLIPATGRPSTREANGHRDYPPGALPMAVRRRLVLGGAATGAAVGLTG